MSRSGLEYFNRYVDGCVEKVSIDKDALMHVRYDKGSITRVQCEGAVRECMNLANVIVQSWSIGVDNDSGAGGWISERTYEKDHHSEHYEDGSVFDYTGVREGFRSKAFGGGVEERGETMGFHTV